MKIFLLALALVTPYALQASDPKNVAKLVVAEHLADEPLTPRCPKSKFNHKLKRARNEFHRDKNQPRKVRKAPTKKTDPRMDDFTVN